MRVLHLLESGGLYGAERVVLNLSAAMRAAGAFEPVIGCIVQHDDEPSALYDEARRQGIAAEKVRLRNFGLAMDVPREARRGVDSASGWCIATVTRRRFSAAWSAACGPCP